MVWGSVPADSTMFVNDDLFQNLPGPPSESSNCEDGRLGESCPTVDSSNVLDLKGEFAVDYVIVNNRDDCCFNFIIGAVVELLSESDEILHTCGTITETRMDYTVYCDNKLGSKVRVRHLEYENLKIGKIDVHGKLDGGEKNLLSRRKPTWLSNIYGGYSSLFAVDGIYENYIHKFTLHRNCFHTLDDKMPFWVVDLQGIFNIAHVILFNRMDCCSERIIGAVVELLSEAGEMKHQCGEITESQAIYNISCGTRSAQKVRVRGAARQFLHLCEVEVFGVSESVSSNPNVISRRKPTSQSSLYYGLDSALAVDGKYENYINRVNSHGNCFHTQNDAKPFWTVDLQQTSNIGNVVLYNRMDCCSERIVGAVVELLNRNGDFKHECGKILESKSVYNISCGKVKAQLVRIRGAPNQYLHVCEVDVFGDVVEKPIPLISKGKPTSQSSVYLGLDSALAVDGRYDNYLMTGTVLNRNCFHTSNDKMPFWMVDLQGTFDIDHVSLYNRMDCCSDRIIGAVVELVNGAGELIQECGKITQSKDFYRIPCSKRSAQKVRIRGAPNQYLHLCEVDVFGDKSA